MIFSERLKLTKEIDRIMDEKNIVKTTMGLISTIDMMNMLKDTNEPKGNKMIEVTKEIIEKVNNKCPYDQGIFTEPYGIPIDIKEPVVYTRYDFDGYRGGSCWDTEAKYFKEDPPKNEWIVLELLLEEIMPNITFLQYKKINNLIHDNFETQREYYGNSTTQKIQYIKVSELVELLNNIK